LGFLHPEWFVEQHCLVRGRFGRALVAMQTLNLKYGVGVDENTAVVVRNGREMDVIGARGAIVMDLSQATSDRDKRGFNLKNARLSYLDFGDAFDLAELRLTPSPQKQATQNLDPAGAAPQPVAGEKLVETNILGNNTLVELMTRLIESRQTEAIGLAFDAGTALKQATSGFEFRFYREADSRGWYPAGTHGGTYTVQNIHLDIRRIEIAGPLYK
jgi:cyanophycinase